jgi:hypothetical protein
VRAPIKTAFKAVQLLRPAAAVVPRVVVDARRANKLASRDELSV